MCESVPRSFGRSTRAAQPQPVGRKAHAAMLGEHMLDGGLIRLRGCGRKGQRDLAEAQLEQPVAAPRAVIVALRRRAGRGSRSDDS